MSGFLITGLPRSRTAWMSALCNTLPGVYCEHEPLKKFDRWQDVGPFMETAGVSDSAFGFHLTEIMDLFNPRVLVIERPIDRVEASLERLGFRSSAYCRVLLNRLSQFKRESFDRPDWTNQVQWVSVRSLANPMTIDWYLRHLVPGCEPDMRKVRQFMGMNIQVHLDADWRKSTERPAHVVSALLGQDVVNEIASAA